MEVTIMKKQYTLPEAILFVMSPEDILTDSLANRGAYLGECSGSRWDSL